MDTIEARVLEQVDPAEVVELLQALIRLRSDYPPGDCRAVIAAVAAKLAQAGLESETLARKEHQPSLIARLGNEDQGSVLMFHAHIDTVPSGDLSRWSVDPFSGELKDGKVYGRGAGDDKSSVVAQLIAMLALARAGVDLQGRLLLAVVSDEESGGEQGTHWLHEEGKLRTDALVVGEQTNNRVAIAERVACGIDLTVYGKSAHGAMPWAGENAVLKAARALTWLQDHLFPRLQARVHPYLPPAT
ncbi:MAG TPA: M20/M25/M40 family metallo-hydrolase, partial [Anaerolineales bacterium]